MPHVDVEGFIAASTPLKYGTAAAFTMLLYDYALTFDTEVEYVWKRTWSFGKALFIFNRYFSILALLSNVIGTLSLRMLSLLIRSFEVVLDPSCQRYTWWNVTLEIVAIISAEIILLIRIHAVYDCNRRLFFAMVALFMAEVVSFSIIGIHGVPAIMWVKDSGSTGCRNEPAPPGSFVAWLSPLIFETILMSLMVYKGWRTYTSRARSELLHLIIRDSMFITLLANCIVYIMSAKPGSQMDPKLALNWAVAIPCTLGSRLLLNMRERYYKASTTMATSLNVETSGIVFNT
ncbi:hypothetical protein JB92DRAFT_2830414 [Gautieria morchelliformis]|nr:hypothetical protein JB92DRAFT_2830414 [Gautieria morchelliformis]